MAAQERGLQLLARDSGSSNSSYLQESTQVAAIWRQCGFKHVSIDAGRAWRRPGPVSAPRGGSVLSGMPYRLSPRLSLALPRRPDAAVALQSRVAQQAVRRSQRDRAGLQLAVHSPQSLSPGLWLGARAPFNRYCLAIAACTLAESSPRWPSSSLEFAGLENCNTQTGDRLRWWPHADRPPLQREYCSCTA